jgi:hypothetical protein
LELANVTKVFCPPTIMPGGRTAVLRLKALAVEAIADPARRKDPAPDSHAMLRVIVEPVHVTSAALAAAGGSAPFGASGSRSLHRVTRSAAAAHKTVRVTLRSKSFDISTSISIHETTLRGISRPAGRGRGNAWQ